MTELFLKILGMSVTASLAAAIVLVLRLILKPAPRIFSYVLWAAVYIRLLIPFSLPLPAAEISPITPLDIRTEPYTYEKNINNGVPLSADISESMEISIYTNDKIPEYKARKTSLEIISAIWLAGVLIMAARWIISSLRLKNRLKSSRPLEENISISENIPTPFIFGIINPKIYLPETLTESRQRLIIQHEKYHIKRLDHITKIIMYAALCIHWFNPAVWLCFKLCENDMEMSCDEAVTEKMSRAEKADYSEALLEAAPKKAAMFTAGFSESGTGKRIKNVLKFQKPTLWITILCAIAAGISVIALSSDRSPENAPPNESEFTVTEGTTSQNPLNEIAANPQTAISLIESSGQQYPFTGENNAAALKIISETKFAPTELYEYVPSEFELRINPKDRPHAFGEYAFATAENAAGEPIFAVTILSANTEYTYSIPEESYKALKELADLTYNNAVTELENIPLKIPVIPASPVFLQSVYFGSELPRLLYANEYNTVFTDGMSGLYLCNDHSVLWAADIGSSFATYKDKFPFEIGAPGWNGISMGAFIDENGQLRLWCSINAAGSNHSIKYIIDLETNTLSYIEEIPEDSRNIKPFLYYDFSESAPKPLDNNIIYYSDTHNEFVSLAENEPVNTPYRLSMIKLDRHTHEGVTEFVPFPESSPAINPEACQKLHFGTYRLSGNEDAAALNSVTITPLGSVSIMFSPLSSFMCIGTAELNNDLTKLIVNASDGGRYVFEISGDSLIYRQSESIEGISASPKEMGGAYEGAVYTYSEE
ncbi:MAG: M56 family metallopeptidase [Oscillospiraceae bacterium]|nr:M56 family metallopeptidase [Oscillospiraceae bacterium]